MGLYDRDYMRERYRQRQGLDPGKVQWNDRAARADLPTRSDLFNPNPLR
ncbi:hypothetical protein S2M10_24560 [Sphingomonas sp. S2M10]|nr:hypothetical protein [Sphingomonas sp. S2M10]